jgi:hypothetical protein
VREFLERNPHVHFHFTPTYSSWLNHVELWFLKIEREGIARGVFTSSSATISYGLEAKGIPQGAVALAGRFLFVLIFLWAGPNHFSK